MESVSMKRRIYQILNLSSRKGDLSWWFDFFLITLISLNAVAITLESVAAIREKYHALFDGFELFSVLFFSVEYILRLWTANENEKFRRPLTGNIRYAMTPMAIVDFLAVLPFFLPFFVADLRLLRIIRIFRLFRLFKIARYIRALTIINDVIRDKREELLLSTSFMLFLLLISSTLMYYVEHEAQPDIFPNIPETMWWAIATLTTVGYGDVYPITGLGKFLGGAIAILGIGLFALPAGILSSGFSKKVGKSKRESKCPNCGHVINNKTE